MIDELRVIELTETGEPVILTVFNRKVAVVMSHEHHRYLVGRTDTSALASSERDELRQLRWQVAKLRGLAGAVLDHRPTAEQELRRFLTQHGAT